MIGTTIAAVTGLIGAISGGVAVAGSTAVGITGAIRNKKAREEGAELAQIQRGDVRNSDLLKQGQEIKNQRTAIRGLEMKREEDNIEEQGRQVDMKTALDDTNRSVMNNAQDSQIKGLSGSLARNVKSIERLRQ